MMLDAPTPAKLAGGGGAQPLANLSSREFRLLERLANHVHYATRRTARAAVRQPGSKGRAIFTVRLRNLEATGLVRFGRVQGRLAVVLTAAGERLVAERRERRRQRLRAPRPDEPVAWWL